MSDTSNNLPHTRPIPSATELMQLPGREAELVLNALPFAVQLDCVLQVPWKDRMDVIMQSHAARELVQALPPEEVFWMVKQRGVEDSLPVIARTTHDQFQYLVDLDCWQREQLVPENLLAWFKVLARCNLAKVLEWFDQADTSLLIAGLKTFVSVHKIEEESDISEEYEAMPPCTIDGINFFRFASEDAQIVLLPLLKVLLNNDTARFQSLIEGLIWDSRIEAEDEALHWRQSRASENGFPFFDEALGIYQPLDESEIKQLNAGLPDRPSHQARGTEGEIRLRYVMAQGRLPGFLRDSLSSLDAGELERFEQLLITTANKVMVADCMEVRNLDDVRQALHKTAGYISIGLESISADNPETAPGIVRDKHPETLFRCGYSLVNMIAERVRGHSGVIWTGNASRFHSFYGTPLAETVLGLVRSRPLFYEGISNPESSLYRDFETLADVRSAETAVDCLTAAEKILFTHAGLSLAGLEDTYRRCGAIQDPVELTMQALLATLLISRSLDATADIPLIDPDGLAQFCAQLNQSAKSPQAALAKFADQSVGWIAAELVQGAIDKRILTMLVNECLAPVQEVLENASGPEADLRYVSAVLLQRA